MGIRNKVTGEMYTITSYNPSTGNITGINNVGGNSDLGNVSNVYIGGGNPGEVLSTDGAGNLSWIAAGGGANTGNITFNNTTISAPAGDTITVQSLDNDGLTGPSLTLDAGSTLTRLRGLSSQDNGSWTTADWATGVYTTQGGGSIGAIEFTGATNIISFVDALQGYTNVYFQVDGGPLLVSDGWSASPTNITFYTPTLPATDPTTVTSFAFYYSLQSSLEMDYDAQEFTIYSNSLDLILQTTDAKDIEINSSRSVSITGNGSYSLSNFSETDPIEIRTDASNASFAWSFGANGVLALPTGSSVIDPTDNNFEVRSINNINFEATSDVNISTGGGTGQWKFDSDGNLTIPGTTGGLIKTVSNASIGIVAIDNGTDNPAQVMSWNESGGAPTTIISAYASNATIQTNVTASMNTWQFLANAVTVFPGDLQGSGASPAPSINGFNSASFAGNVTANLVIGDGGYLSNIAGANVVGEVALANTVSNPAQPNITSVGTLVSLTTGALNTTGQFTANGNVQFNQDVYFAGNVTLPGNINQISGNSASFFGDPVTGFGGLYVGIPSGYTLLNNEVAQFADNFNGYTQITHQNINGGDQATGDFVITADNGTDLVNHIDLGIAGSGYDGALANNSLGTVLNPNDGYLYTRGNVTGGNLVLGSNQANGVVRIIANGASNIGDVVATFAANGLTVAANVSANYFIGNGSQLTDMYANANVATYLASNSNVVITTTGNITSTANISGAYIKGNGSQLTGMYGNTQVAAYLPVNTSSVSGNNFTASGNIVAGSLGSQEQLVGYTANATSVVFDLMGNFPQAFNAGQTIYVSGITAGGPTELNGYWLATAANLDSVTVACTLQPTLPFGMMDIVYGQVANIRNVTATGNIVGGYLVGNGSQITNIAGANVSGEVDFAATANSVAVANVSGIGNIATINLNGNASTVLIGNGAWSAPLTPAPVIGTMTSGANITPTTSDTQYNVTALAVSSNVDAPTGTPADGQKLTIRIVDNGTAQSLTWDAIYQVIGTTLPTTTVAGKYVYIGVIYNAQETTWDVVSVAQQA